MIIGIDFGTCFSSVSYMSGNRPISDLLSEFEINASGLPTQFAFSRENGEVFAKDCQRLGEEFGGVVKYMKRIIREHPDNINKTVVSNGRSYTYGQIVKKYLSYLFVQTQLEAKKRGFDPTIEEVTIACPVAIAKGQMTSTGYREFLMSTVGEITNLPANKIHIVEEPVAAAMGYLYYEDLNKMYSKNQTFLVFDLGGGTLDVTVVEHDSANNTHIIRAKEGDLELGGNEWDTELMEYVLEEAGIDDIDDFIDPYEKIRFLENITKLKHELTEYLDSDVSFSFNGRRIRGIEVTRDDFEDLTEHLLDRAIEVTEKAIDFAMSHGASSIDKIILVGGSCNMPQIQRRMREEFPFLGKDNIIAFQPSKAIANGAAIYNKRQSSHRDTYGGKPPIEPIDIAAHTYGFGSRNNGKDMIYNLIYRGTPIRDRIVEKSKTSFVALQDNQEIITFRVYESDAEKEMYADEENWFDYGLNENRNGLEVSIDIPYEYLGRARQFSTWVTLSLDKNGILEIIITDENNRPIKHASKQI